MELVCNQSKHHQVPWISMELGDIWFGDAIVPWNSIEYSIEFNGAPVPPNRTEFQGIPRNFEIVLFPKYRVPLDFHGIIHGIPWNFCITKSNVTEFHGIPWNFQSYILLNIGSFGIPWNIPWNSMELLYRQIKYHQVPWNSTEHGDC